MQTATCTICHQEKPIEAFTNNRRTRKGELVLYQRKQCKQCRSQQHRARLVARFDTKERQKYHGLTKLKTICRDLHIPLETVFDTLKKQQGRCFICHDPIEFFVSDIKRRACLDHDHKTNQFRGVLCNWCNAGLGCFDDNVERLARSQTYLTNPQVSLQSPSPET
jgi:hypothetical protein